MFILHTNNTFTIGNGTAGLHFHSKRTQCPVHGFSLSKGALSCDCGNTYHPHHIVSTAHTHRLGESKQPWSIIYLLVVHDGSYGLLENELYSGDDDITAFITEVYLLRR